MRDGRYHSPKELASFATGPYHRDQKEIGALGLFFAAILAISMTLCQPGQAWAQVDDGGIPADSCFSKDPDGKTAEARRECFELEQLMFEFDRVAQLAESGDRREFSKSELIELGVSEALSGIVGDHGVEGFTDYILARYLDMGDRYSDAVIRLARVESYMDSHDSNYLRSELDQVFDRMPAVRSSAWNGVHAVALSLRARLAARGNSGQEEIYGFTTEALDDISENWKHDNLKSLNVWALTNAASSMRHLGDIDRKISNAIALGALKLQFGDETKAGQAMMSAADLLTDNSRPGAASLYTLAYGYLCERNRHETCQRLSQPKR